MGIYEKNLASIRGRYPELTEYLERQQAPEEEETGADGISFGVSDVAGKQVLYAIKRQAGEERLIQLDSLYDSEKLLELWRADQKSLPKYQTKCIFCGLGNGMYVKKTLEAADDTARVLVYEPSARLFDFVVRHFDISDLLADSRVTVIVEEYYARSFEDELYRIVAYSDLENLIYQAYPNYDRLFLERTKETDHILQMMYNSVRATQNVLDRYGSWYTTNGMRNMTYFFDGKSINDFYCKVDKDLPVIIAASGPSLDKNMEDLKAAKGKCLLVGLDSSVKALLRHDIVPDLFVSVDATKDINHFTDRRVSDIPMICELSSNFEALNMHRGKKFFVNDMNAYVNGFFVRRNILFPVFTTGGSVANTACSIFSSMGFKTIILVGQDLAYTNLKTHASDTVRGLAGEKADKLDGFFVEGYDGNQVKTSYEFQLYLKWFEEEIVNNPDVTYIDATEGGAMIHGAQNISLKSVVQTYCGRERQIQETLATISDFLTEELKQEFAAHLLQLPEHLKHIRHLAEKAARKYAKMKELAYCNQYQSREFKKLSGETRALDQELESEAAVVYIQNIVQSNTSQIMQKINDMKKDVKEEILEICETGECYLKSMIKATDVLTESETFDIAMRAAKKHCTRAEDGQSR